MALLQDDKPARTSWHGSRAVRPQDDAVIPRPASAQEAKRRPDDAQEAVFDIEDFRAIARFAGIHRKPRR